MSLHLCLPKYSKTIIRLDNDDWNLSFNSDYSEIFESSESQKYIQHELVKYVDSSFADYRVQIVLKSVPFLAAVYFETKEIQLFSPRLNRELFLVENLSTLSEVEKNKIIDNNEWEEFKSKVEKVASLKIQTFPTVIERLTKDQELPDLDKDKKYQDIIPRTYEIIEKLLFYVNDYTPGLFERFSDFGLGLTARYALLRIHLLKFLAILPSLDHDEDGSEVKRILLETFRRLIEDSAKAKRLRKKGQSAPLPASYLLACRLVFYIAKVFPAAALASFVRMNVRFMAKRFIAGETIETAEKSFNELFKSNRDVTLDQLGELVVSEKEADHYCNEVLNLVRGFSLHIKPGSKNGAGINRAHVSIKVSALCSDFKPYAFDYTYEHVAPRLKKILIEAKKADVFINIDAEHYDYRDIVFKVYRKLLLETEELKDYQQTGIVLQAYLRDAHTHLIEIVELAQKRNLMMPIRLVKGAYWDAETIEADAHAFNAPEFLNKEETDIHFRQLIDKIFHHHPHIQLCLASHNFSDHSFAEALREKHYAQIPAIEHQCLHMTYEALSTAMAKMGWPVRNYVPIGSLLVGMAYLVRRIMENSSQVGVLTIMRSHKRQKRMKSPVELHKERKENAEIHHDMTHKKLTSEFFNIRPVRTYLDNEREWMEKALEKFRASSLNQKYENNFSVSGEIKEIVSSSDPSLKVGSLVTATVEDATKAIAKLDDYYNSGEWSKSHWIVRSSVLCQAADLLLARRLELSALIVYEAGKSINEALGDVDEAIDFLSFYAREEGRITRLNKKIESRGTMGVISPWNFPLAIPCGMVSSALVTGSSVVLKSAEQTPLIAQVLVDILHESGVPKDCLIHLHGEGKTVGSKIVNDKRIAGIIFTGSKDVGLLISKQAGARIYENKLTEKKYPVKAITEMGGKNAIIVTANAELDETVAGILYSAFGHAGQKCSAASRVIVHRSVKDRLIERLKEACSDLEVKQAYDFSCTVNPVVSAKDQARLRKQAEQATEEVQRFGGQVVIDRSAEDLPGYCVGPAVFELSSDRVRDKESFFQRELFGPIIHITQYQNLDEAIEIFNSTEYALTGGIFSQSQDDIDYVTGKLECGNIYVNRTITGARVGVEPFGGFKLSGTGPKAGGRAYLNYIHLNPIKEVAETVDEQEGSDYQFDLCGPSRLSYIQRNERVIASLASFTGQFEVYFHEIDGLKKNILRNFEKWCKSNFESFFSRKHWNQRIPGQLSYNDLTMSEEHAVVLCYDDKGSFFSFMQVLGALLMGTGVTVLTRNDKALGWWSEIIALLHRNGFSKENIDVFIASDSQVKATFQNPMLSSIFVDSDIKKLQVIINEVYNLSEPKRMRSVKSVFDGADLNDFKRICAQYSWVRAFAVNTMRHGAPLSLEFDV